MIKLRNCPMCHEGVKDDGVILTAESLIDLEDKSQVCDIGYTVRCCGCGTSVTNEYLEDVISLWNGGYPDD